jgi:hypothetical protein
MKFLSVSVILPTADIVTDIMTAYNFFTTGHVNWGIFTTIPIFAPFAVQLLLQLFDFVKNFFVKKNSARILVQAQTFPKILWHFPLLLPVR